MLTCEINLGTPCGITVSAVNTKSIQAMGVWSMILFLDIKTSSYTQAKNINHK